MLIETTTLPDDAGFELKVNGKYFDTFESVHVLADAVAQLLIFSNDPLNAEFIDGLIQADVVRTPAKPQAPR